MIEGINCLLCGQDIYSPLKEEYQDKLLRAKEAIEEIISKKYKDPQADIVVRRIMLAIEEV